VSKGEYAIVHRVRERGRTRRSSERERSPNVTPSELRDSSTALGMTGTVIPSEPIPRLRSE